MDHTNMVQLITEDPDRIAQSDFVLVKLSVTVMFIDIFSTTVYIASVKSHHVVHACSIVVVICCLLFFLGLHVTR